MDKDKAIIKFKLNSYKIEVLPDYKFRPHGFTTIDEWLCKRTKFTCACDPDKIFMASKMGSMDDKINKNHLVAVTDTFWVKEIDDPIEWDAVNPYKNRHSELLSVYGLEGLFIDDNSGYMISPQLATKGSFPHTWRFDENGHLVFMKAGTKYTFGAINSGREPFSEYYACQVAKHLGFDCVDYQIKKHVRHNGKIDVITECKSYTSEDIGSASAQELSLESYEEILEYSKKLSDTDFEKILDMLFLDCLLMNEDRHLNNIEFLVDNSNLKVIGVAPIYDNNMSFLPYFMEDRDEFNRESYMTSDRRSFDKLYKLVRKYKSYDDKLESIKGLRLDKPNGVDITEERLEFLNKFLQNQVDYLLMS